MSSYVQNLKSYFVPWAISAQGFQRTTPLYDAYGVVARDQYGTTSPKINKSDKGLADPELVTCRACITLPINQAHKSAAKRSIRHLYHMYGTTLPPSAI